MYRLHNDRLCCFVCILMSAVSVFMSQTGCFQCVFCICAFVSLLHLMMTKHPLYASDILHFKRPHFIYSTDLLCLFILMLQCYIFSSDRTSSEHPREPGILSWDHVWNLQRPRTIYCCSGKSLCLNMSTQLQRGHKQRNIENSVIYTVYKSLSIN